MSQSTDPAANETRSDPISVNYFHPLEVAEKWSDRLFYVAALLSFAALLVDKATFPELYDVVQAGFALTVGAVFALGLAIRLYWTPRAEDQRRLDLLSNAHGVALTHERTSGYYNNEQIDAMKRLGAAVLENSLFSRAIALEMAKEQRIKVALYVILFLVAVFYRRTDLAVVAAAAQAVFSEQIVSRWFRIEWLRARCDQTYKHLYALFQSQPAKKTFNAKVVEWFAHYETSKSNAGILLSERIFKRLNPTLSAEWDKIKGVLGI